MSEDDMEHEIGSQPFTDKMIYKYLDLFNAMLGEWVSETKKELAEETIRSLKTHDIEIADDLKTAIHAFQDR